MKQGENKDIPCAGVGFVNGVGVWAMATHVMDVYVIYRLLVPYSSLSLSLPSL